MNGEPLPLEHGFPVRMIVPGLYGYVSATKWLVDLELTTLDAYDAYWIQRGWAKEAPVKTQSRIDTPAVASVVSLRAGRRWRGSRGRSTEASNASRCGSTTAAGRRPSSGPTDTIDTWRQWVYRWDASARARTRWRSERPTARARRRRPTAPLRSRTARPAITRSCRGLLAGRPGRFRQSSASPSSRRRRRRIADSPITWKSASSATSTTRAVIEADLHAVGRTVVPRFGLDHGAAARVRERCGGRLLERGAGERLVVVARRRDREPSCRPRPPARALRRRSTSASCPSFSPPRSWTLSIREPIVRIRPVRRP